MWLCPLPTRCSLFVEAIPTERENTKRRFLWPKCALFLRGTALSSNQGRIGFSDRAQLLELGARPMLVRWRVTQMSAPEKPRCIFFQSLLGRLSEVAPRNALNPESNLSQCLGHETGARLGVALRGSCEGACARAGAQEWMLTYWMRARVQ